MRESQLDWLPGYDKKFAEVTHDMVNDLEKCLQCGKCTSQCPAAKISSYNPRRIIRDLRVGNIEKVISSQELWLCFFCGSCYAVCPRDINFPYAVAMIRYPALDKGYGWSEVQKVKDPYAQDYYKTGLSVSPHETNLGVKKEVAKNSHTDGRMSSVREKMGIAPEREVSEQAISEIRFIADATGMTDLFKDIDKKENKEKQWNYGSPADMVKIKRAGNDKFEDLQDKED